MKPLLKKNCKLGQDRNCLKEKGQKDAPEVIKCERCSELCDKIKKIVDVVTDFQCCVMLHRDRWGLIWSDGFRFFALYVFHSTLSSPQALMTTWHVNTTPNSTLQIRQDGRGWTLSDMNWCFSNRDKAKFMILQICFQFNFKIYIPISMPRLIILISIYIIWTICITVENSHFMTVA